MADTLCGPSNPLQSFRKHTQLDRTLQQDRLVGPRHSPAAEQFRRQDLRAGSLDADLHAFENAQPNPLDLQQSHAFGRFQQQPASAGWAADFQNLHISQTPSPVPVSQFRTEAPLIKTTNGGWHHDFLRQSGSVTPVAATAKGKEVLQTGYEMPQQHQFYTQPAMYGGMLQNSGVMMEQQPLQQSGHDFAQMSDEAFEAAFQEAYKTEAQALQQQEASPNLQPEQGHDMEISKSDIRIGSDAINYTEVKDRTADQDTRDADELARTAGQLLNLVQHDTSQKFQNSQFLDLMRKIRDREVEVQNNDMVVTTEPTPPTANVEQHQDAYHAATAADSDYQFHFPDMNEIYAPTNNDLDTASRSYESGTVTPSKMRVPDSWDYPVTTEPGLQSPALRSSSVPPVSRNHLADPMYQSGSDEFPASQIQALHPGGKWYPEMNSPEHQKAEMSGAVDAGGISADDFEGVYEESSMLGRRFGSLNQVDA